MVSDQTKAEFFTAVEDAGGQVIHNRVHKDERGRYIPEIRLSSPERDAAEAARKEQIRDRIVAEFDRLHPSEQASNDPR